MKTEALLQALNTVRPGLGTSEYVEQSTNFAFKDGFVFTYNDQISISYPLEEDAGIEGAVSSKELFAFLSKVTAKEVKLSVNGNELLVKAGRSRAGFPIQTEVVLQRPDFEGANWKEITPQLVKKLQFIAMAASTDASTPDITGIHIRTDGIIEAGDRYRVARYESDIEVDENVLFPADIMPTVVSLKPLFFCVHNGWIHFESENNTILSCRTIDAVYPKLDHIFQEDDNAQDIVFPSTLRAIIERAEVFTREQMMFDQSIDFFITKNLLTAKVQADIGWFEERAKIDYDSDEEFKFNVVPVVLKDILKSEFTSVKLNILTKSISFSDDKWVYVIAIGDLT